MVHHHSRGQGLTSDSSRTRLVDELRRDGIVNERVLAAITRVPRHEFVEEALRGRAYDNNALPIGLQQTISQPYVVALMTQALLGNGQPQRVLELGTGSGYQTAVLAELIPSVFSVERIRSLSEQARERLNRLGYHNVIYGYSDGMNGWPAYAPYDSIIVTAAAADVPAKLLEQLMPGGRLVIPVGARGRQMLRLIESTPTGLRSCDLCAVSFVPLLAGKE